MLTLGVNIASRTAQRHLAAATARIGRVHAQLSSGLRIVRAADDVARLPIADRFGSKARGITLEERAAEDELGLAQASEAGLGSISDLLVRLRELAVFAHDGAKTASDRVSADLEFQELLEEVDRIVESTEVNGASVLGGAGVADLGLEGASLVTLDGAAAALPALDSAIDDVGFMRAKHGARIRAIESRLRVLAVRREAAIASESRIRDLDYAAATAELAKATIQQQAALSVLGQANAQAELVLRLLPSL